MYNFTIHGQFSENSTEYGISIAITTKKIISTQIHKRIQLFAVKHDQLLLKIVLQHVYLRTIRFLLFNFRSVKKRVGVSVISVGLSHNRNATLHF